MSNYERYIEDRKFIKWVFTPDLETENYFANYLRENPDEKEDLQRARMALQLLSVKENEALPGKKDEIFKKIKSDLEKQKRLEKWWGFKAISRYAAVAILFFAIGSLFMYSQLHETFLSRLNESLLLKSTGTNTTIYLADGIQKQVPDAKTLIDFSKSNRLIIGMDTTVLKQAASPDLKNLVVVPYGKRAMVKLSDESMVSLNAGSRIIFPNQFDQKERNVYLVGEAFFNVTKNRQHPFYVETSRALVRVLGTSFDVTAYPDQKETTAYLEEGIVQICGNKNALFSSWVEIKPHEMATVNNETNKINVNGGNVEYYRFWKNGVVSVENEPITHLVDQVGQYFNVMIKIENHSEEERVNGKLDLNRSMVEVFEYLEKITHRKIIKTGTGEFLLN